MVGHQRHRVDVPVLALLPPIRALRTWRPRVCRRHQAGSCPARPARRRPPLLGREAWNPDPVSATNIVDGLFIVPTGFGPLPSTNNPVNVRFDGEQFIMISNPGDWWGDRVFIATAAQPQGPWTVTSEEELVVGKCDGRSTDCSTYYGSWCRGSTRAVTTSGRSVTTHGTFRRPTPCGCTDRRSTVSPHRMPPEPSQQSLAGAPTR